MRLYADIKQAGAWTASVPHNRSSWHFRYPKKRQLSPSVSFFLTIFRLSTLRYFKYHFHHQKNIHVDCHVGRLSELDVAEG